MHKWLCHVFTSTFTHCAILLTFLCKVKLASVLSKLPMLGLDNSWYIDYSWWCLFWEEPVWCCSTCQRSVCWGARLVGAVFFLCLNKCAKPFIQLFPMLPGTKRKQPVMKDFSVREWMRSRTLGSVLFSFLPPWAELSGEYLLSITDIISGSVSHTAETKTKIKRTLCFLFWQLNVYL